jgi:hypothetical protein
MSERRVRQIVLASRPTTPIDSMTHGPHPEEAPQVGHARLRMTCALLQDEVH